MSQHQTLIGTQLARQQTHALQLVPQHHLSLHLRAGIDDRRLLAVPQRDCGLERRLHGAAAREGAPAVVHAGDETKLERVRCVGPVRKPASLAGVSHELERGLAEAIFEVLPPQAVAVGAQQHLALGARHDRQLFDRVACAPSYRQLAADRERRLALVSGTHMGMSRAGARRPPSQFPPRPRARRRAAVSRARS